MPNSRLEVQRHSDLRPHLEKILSCVKSLHVTLSAVMADVAAIRKTMFEDPKNRHLPKSFEADNRDHQAPSRRGRAFLRFSNAGNFRLPAMDELSLPHQLAAARLLGIGKTDDPLSEAQRLRHSSQANKPRAVRGALSNDKWT